MNRKLAFLLIFSLILIFAAPFFGGLRIPISAPIMQGPMFTVFWQLRLPRVLLGYICGSMLGLCGLLSQTLFRNSLASPDVLGISSGAAVGAALASRLGSPVWLLGISSLYLFGFGGALLAVGMILAIARLMRSLSVYTLLMSGVALNMFFSALVVLIQYLLEMSNVHSLLHWLMGGVAIIGYAEIKFLFVLLMAVFLFSTLFSRTLILMAGGDDFAATRGLHVERFRRGLLIFLALANGATVAVTGPIGFVSLIVPHMARLQKRLSFRQTAVSSALIGGILLTMADALARVLFSPAEIPVGLVTSFFGAPFFLYLLTKRLRRPNS